MHFYGKNLGVDNLIRVVYYNDEGDNFWYDIEAPFPEGHYFYAKESLGYAMLYFVDQAPLYGTRAPKWVKRESGWE